MERTEPAWLQAERDYQDELPDECTVPELFEDSAARHLDRTAQQYKGGVYDRSLVAAGVVDAAPAGAYADLDYAVELAEEDAIRIGVDAPEQWASAIATHRDVRER